MWNLEDRVQQYLPYHYYIIIGVNGIMHYKSGHYQHYMMNIITRICTVIVILQYLA